MTGVAEAGLLALLLGVRHAADADHLAAVATLVADRHEGGAQRSGLLGLSWGVGHALTCFVLGLAVVVAGPFLPGWVETGAEAAIGVLIVALAVRLLWHRRAPPAEVVAATPAARTPVEAFAIGTVHGVGGSAAAAALVVAAQAEAVQAIAVLVAFTGVTAVVMAFASAGLGAVLVRGPLARARAFVPTLAVASLVFGAWYLLHALGAA